jgi:GT2 family glycosyltransferase
MINKESAIVLLNWNGWQDTIACLRTILKIDKIFFKIIIVDNCSNDNSIQKIQEFLMLNQEFHIELIRNNQNLGFGGGNNVGIQSALEQNYEFIWLLNTDTLLPPNALEIMYETMINNPRVGALGAILTNPDQPKNIQAWGGGSVNLLTGHSWHAVSADMSLTYLMGASMYLRAEALRQVGMFDEKFFYTWEDADLSFRFVAAGWDLMTSSVRIEHREAASTGKFSSTRMYYFAKGLTTFLRKHSPVPCVAIPIAVSLKLGRAIFKRRLNLIPSLLRGFRDGLR